MCVMESSHEKISPIDFSNSSVKKYKIVLLNHGKLFESWWKGLGFSLVEYIARDFVSHFVLFLVVEIL